MSTNWIMTVPLVGIAYAAAAAGCVVWAIRRRTETVIWSLSGLIFSVALLNGYAEKWLPLKGFGFGYAAPALVVLFVLTYRSFCLRLIERTGLRHGFAKEQYSGLPEAYALFAGGMIVPLFVRKTENPALWLLAVIALVCALHVPMFAFGRSKIGDFLLNAGLAASKAVPDISWSFLAIATAVLGAPLVLTLIIRAAPQGDYRLFAFDAVLTVVTLSLLVISRRGRFDQRAPAREAGRGGNLSQSL